MHYFYKMIIYETDLLRQKALKIIAKIKPKLKKRRDMNDWNNKTLDKTEHLVVNHATYSDQMPSRSLSQLFWRWQNNTKRNSNYSKSCMMEVE